MDLNLNIYNGILFTYFDVQMEILVYLLYCNSISETIFTISTEFRNIQLLSQCSVKPMNGHLSTLTMIQMWKWYFYTLPIVFFIQQWYCILLLLILLIICIFLHERQNSYFCSVCIITRIFIVFIFMKHFDSI